MRRPPSGCRIVEIDTERKNSTRFEAYCDRDDVFLPDNTLAGRLTVYRYSGRIQGRVAWLPHVYVQHSAQRRGVATALYEAAAAFACKRRGRLVSIERLRDSYSNQFWQKQESKGRAHNYQHGNYHSRVYVLDVCGRSEIDLSGV